MKEIGGVYQISFEEEEEVVLFIHLSRKSVPSRSVGSVAQVVSAAADYSVNLVTTVGVVLCQLIICLFFLFIMTTL